MDVTFSLKSFGICNNYITNNSNEANLDEGHE